MPSLITVTDNSNGMKYFHKFIIQGQTAFYKGITVLSKEGDNAELSFIKEDGTVQPSIYEALHDGEKLAGRSTPVNTDRAPVHCTF
jgi:hypothetical protein